MLIRSNRKENKDDDFDSFGKVMPDKISIRDLKRKGMAYLRNLPDRLRHETLSDVRDLRMQRHNNLGERAVYNSELNRRRNQLSGFIKVSSGKNNVKVIHSAKTNNLGDVDIQKIKPSKRNKVYALGEVQADKIPSSTVNMGNLAFVGYERGGEIYVHIFDPKTKAVEKRLYGSIKRSNVNAKDFGSKLPRIEVDPTSETVYLIGADSDVFFNN